MFKISILIIFSLLSLNVLQLRSQNGFIRTYETISNYSESLIDIIPIGDTILGIGLSQNGNAPFEFGLLLIEFDTMGEIVNTNHVYSSTHSSYLFQPPSKIITLKNGNYAISGGILSSPLRVFFLEFDKHCNEINYFEYVDSNASYFSSSRLIQIDSGFLLFGTVNYLTDKKNDVFIKKIDNNGIELWTKYYGDSAKDEFFLSAKIVSSNSILVGSERNFHSTPSSIADWYKSWFFKIDTLGQISSSWESNVDEIEVGPISMQIDSLKALTYISQTYTTISGQAIRIFPTLVKRDSAFNLIWRKVIGLGTINAPNVFHEIIRDNKDNGWIMVGETAKFSSINAGYGEVCSWMFKVTQEGDSLWDRKDTIYWSQQGTFQNNTPGIIQTPKGDIYSCGYNTQYSPFVNVRATLVKVDRNGCIQKDCNLVNLVEPNPLEGIQVYPNPTTGKIEFSGIDYCRISIFDIYNKLIFDQATNSPIDISALPDGIYFLLFYNKGEILTKRIIKADGP